MHIDPVVISLVALSVSALGFLHSLYTGSIQRRLQVEQMRLNTRSILAKSSFAVVDYARKVMSYPGQESATAAESLTKLADTLTDTWSRVGTLRIPALLPSGLLSPSWQELQHDAEEIHSLIVRLKDMVGEMRFDELALRAQQIEDRIRKTKNR